MNGLSMSCNGYLIIGNNGKNMILPTTSHGVI